MVTHTFVVLAYKKSKYLEACIQSVLNQEYRSQVVVATSPHRSGNRTGLRSPPIRGRRSLYPPEYSRQSARIR